MASKRNSYLGQIVIYASHDVVGTEFKWRVTDRRKVHAGHLVDMTEAGTFIQDGFVRVSGLRCSEWFGPTGHYRLEYCPHRQ